MPRKPRSPIRNVCFVTGTRAEFGLMDSVLRAIQSRPTLRLQIVATGMHLNRKHGDGLAAIRRGGYRVDRTVGWAADSSPTAVARATGQAIASLAAVFDELETDVVLIVGDRVEGFAGAAAAALSGRTLAHVHGGDRALGQLDDSLRHAITKLAHVHFPATAQSARRLVKLGEERTCIHVAGSPGIDGIVRAATPRGALREVYPVTRRPFVLLLLHPSSSDDRVEGSRAELLMDSARRAGISRIIVIGPNNDPGSPGILRAWSGISQDGDIRFYADISRPHFLGLLRDAGCLIGNSSSGIIEAASFGTPVLDVGPRQHGRERNGNVKHVDFAGAALLRAIKDVWRGGHPRHFLRKNLYGSGRAGATIARILAELHQGHPTPKLITY